MKYFDRIKVAVHNVKAEGDILWDSIKDRG